MKSTHNKAEQQVPKEIKYPCLMISIKWKDVVLFEKEKCGTLVFHAGESSDDFGEYSKNWNMSNFTPLPPTESVTLSND